MQVRRNSPAPDLRSLPLDGCDMLLCSHLDQMLSLIDLAELLPCELPEAMDRVRNLVELGVLELVDEVEITAPGRSVAPRAGARPSVAPVEAPSGSTARVESRPPGVRVSSAPTLAQRSAALPDSGSSVESFRAPERTGVRARSDIDRASAHKALIGAIAIERRPAVAALEKRNLSARRRD